MDTPGVFIMSSRAGEAIARALGELLSKNGIRDVEVTRAREGGADDSAFHTPRRMALRHDFGIRIILPADLGTSASRDGVVYDLGVMSGALGVGRGMALFVALDGVDPDLGGLAGLVTDRVALATKGDIEAQLDSYGRLLARRILELDTEAGLVMRPSTGLAIAYLKNFVTPVLELVRARRAALVPCVAGGQALDVQPSRLVVCLPGGTEPFTVEAWAALARRLGLEQAQLVVPGDAGSSRPFGVWADKAGVLYDAPTTLATAAEIVRRMTANASEEQRAQARAVAMHNFGRTLRLLLQESEHAWMQGRLELVRWADLEQRAAP
jgi:hypothetical protein